MIPLFDTDPFFTYDTKDLFTISGYDYENPKACDLQSSSIEIKECLGAEFAVGLWGSRTKGATEEARTETTMQVPEVSDYRMNNMEISLSF